MPRCGSSSLGLARRSSRKFTPALIEYLAVVGVLTATALRELVAAACIDPDVERVLAPVMQIPRGPTPS
jgi:hypothetical protein